MNISQLPPQRSALLVPLQSGTAILLIQNPHKTHTPAPTPTTKDSYIILLCSPTKHIKRKTVTVRDRARLSDVLDKGAGCLSHRRVPATPKKER
ncbi:MAG: hypothetical protein IJB60_06550 [Bacteroidaceae bacterium]|nr:hypothetical protein [Bacteroidaceae bacterium]